MKKALAAAALALSAEAEIALNRGRCLKMVAGPATVPSMLYSIPYEGERCE